MKLFDVYSLFDITPVRAKGTRLWDEEGREYLDFYSGHAVISVGHCHPVYVTAITEQLNKIGFYSNSVINPMQVELARKIGELSSLEDYSLFLVNSGAEANENAVKLASFHTGKDRMLAFRHSFHGRTSAAVAVTDNPKIIARSMPVEGHLRGLERRCRGGGARQGRRRRGDHRGIQESAASGYPRIPSCRTCARDEGIRNRTHPG